MATSSAGARRKAPSPPKHRHDGTSPLPLGMDWSPPPKRWVFVQQADLSKDVTIPLFTDGPTCNAKYFNKE